MGEVIFKDTSLSQLIVCAIKHQRHQSPLSVYYTNTPNLIESNFLLDLPLNISQCYLSFRLSIFWLVLYWCQNLSYWDSHNGTICYMAMPKKSDNQHIDVIISGATLRSLASTRWTWATQAEQGRQNSRPSITLRWNMMVTIKDTYYALTRTSWEWECSVLW